MTSNLELVSEVWNADLEDVRKRRLEPSFPKGLEVTPKPKSIIRKACGRESKFTPDGAMKRAKAITRTSIVGQDERDDGGLI